MKKKFTESVMTKKKYCWVFLLSMIVFANSILLAQDNQQRVTTGKVSDPDGQFIPGVIRTLHGFPKKHRWTSGINLLACAIYGFGLILLSNVTTVTLSIIALMQIGLAQVLIFSSCNSILQTISDVPMTGRVVSLYIMTFMGATTVGYLMMGGITDYVGPVFTLIISGLGCLATSIYLFLSVGSIKKRILVGLRIKKGIGKYAVKEVMSNEQ